MRRALEQELRAFFAEQKEAGLYKEERIIQSPQGREI